jgi:integrase
MAEKPPKPYPDFPLFRHANGQWAKKIDGRFVYFGTDWRAALKKYHVMADGPAHTLKTSIDKYVSSRRLLQESGEITRGHLRDIERTLTGLSATIGQTRTVAGLGSEDYGLWRAHLGKTNGPVALRNHLARVRAFLNWCVREKIIGVLPPCDSLKKPSRGQLRRARAARGSRMFTPQELRRLIECAGPEFRAMILLALNAGLGPEDLAQLKTGNIKGKWLDYPRPKTGVERRVPLWPETQKALAAVIRPDDAAVFRTKYGNLWTATGTSGSGSPISAKFNKLCKGIGIYKAGRGFYSLRHVAQTVGEESGDHAATECILAHCPPSGDMASVYRERMADKRLFRVVKHIRRWLGLARKKTHPCPPLQIAVTAAATVPVE